jgi:hypothetical protein
MTAKTYPKCRFCGRAIEGGVECVACYRARLRRCPICQDVTGKTLPKYHKRRCERCNDEKFILLDQPQETRSPIDPNEYQAAPWYSC